MALGPPPEPSRDGAPRRRALVVVRNAVRYLFKVAARSWGRNLGGAVPALGSMTLLLLLAGLAGLTGYALHSLADREAADAAVLHVYLQDSATPDELSGLLRQLTQDPRVRSIAYTSKQEALASAQHRPGLSQLAGDAAANPFPASFDLKLRRLQDVGPVAASVKPDPAVDPILSTSYDPGVYGRLQAALRWLGVGGGLFLGVLGLVAVLVTANTIRAGIHARREEITIMQLVGAPRWMVRGPFVVEGAMTGAAAGLAAGFVTLVLTAVATRAGAGWYVQLAPGFGFGAGLTAAALVLVAGLALGSGASLIGIRRHLQA